MTEAPPVLILGIGNLLWADGASLDILRLPSEMSTFSIPDMAMSDQRENLDQGMSSLRELAQLLRQQAKIESEQPEAIDITALDDANRTLVDQVLGEGEVSMVYLGRESSARIQESVMAGIWRIRCFDEAGKLTTDTIEAASVPRLCRRNVFKHAAQRVKSAHQSFPEGVLNVWWVQYFNSQDKNILNTLEIGGVPAVAAAASEDIQDSAQRLDEIMEAYRWAVPSSRVPMEGMTTSLETRAVWSARSVGMSE
ncbi:MAG: hydrogenase expression/formation protein [Candidatus Thiodiazotropha sp. (ex Dulcina madagascariensis)]|nr:hydrogenase expression/formation protein [Candidatus Thiodiazotropha sp. (ex Dulcina madagascariensis)]